MINGNLVAVHRAVKNKKQTPASSPKGRSTASINSGKSTASIKSGKSTASLSVEAPDIKQHYNELIKKYDTNRTGRLEADQMRKFLVDLNNGNEISDDEIAYFMKVCDINGSSGIEAGEVQFALQVWAAYAKVLPEINEQLERHDTNNNGRLERDELKNLCIELNSGKEVTDEEVDWLLKEADVMGNGKGKGMITKPEMRRAVTMWNVHVKAKKIEAEACCCMM